MKELSATAKSTYTVFTPNSTSDRLAGMMRRRFFQIFLKETGIQRHQTIIDVGVTDDQAFEHSNYIEAWYPHKEAVTAVGIDDASFLETKYPGVTFKRANGLDLPFPDRSFDFVHSNAVIEHVGSRDNQRRFVAELFRVCRIGLFITTPNRWYPIEFHTVLPLLHWLPVKPYRAILRTIGKEFFAQETNLNLLGPRDLRRVATAAGLQAYRVQATWLGLPSNLILTATKK